MPYDDHIASAWDHEYTNRTINSGEVELHVTDWNASAEGTPLLMLHGLNVQLHTWDPIAKELASDRRVVLLDLRGHGDSAWAPEYHLGSFANDIDEIVKQLELSQVDIIGHSQGARVGLAFSGSRPDSVRHLVLSDNGPQVPRAGVKFAQAALAAAYETRGFASLDEAYEYFCSANPDWRDEFLQLHARHQLKSNWAGRLVYKADPELWWTTFMGKQDVPYLWSMCEKIVAPTLLLRAERSPFVDDDLVKRMSATISKLSTVTVKSCGHYIPRERPDAFVRIVREFLSDQEVRP